MYPWGYKFCLETCRRKRFRKKYLATYIVTVLKKSKKNIHILNKKNIIIYAVFTFPFTLPTAVSQLKLGFYLFFTFIILIY
jgi:hypothetical protein